MSGMLSPESDAERLERRNRELSILTTIAQALNRSVDLEGALQSALKYVADLLDLQTGWIWLLQDGTQEAYLAAAQNLPPGLVQNPSLMEGTCYCLDTFQAGDLEGAANVNVVTCSRLKKLVGGTGGLRYHASIPLYAHGKKLGVLNVASADWRELSPEDLRLLYTAGDMLGIAVERARLYAQSSEAGAVEERNRLARELHDTLAQGLAGIALQLETADALLEAGANPGRVRQSVTQALTQVRASLEEARRSVLDLRAAPLEGRTLAEALAALASETSAKAGLDAQFRSSGATRPLPVRVETGVFRMAQEALANVTQHAGASRASVELSITPAAVKLTVKDNGRGFDPSHIPPGHFGLNGMNERARLMGGSMHIHSSPGKGTKVEVVVGLK